MCTVYSMLGNITHTDVCNFAYNVVTCYAVCSVQNTEELASSFPAALEGITLVNSTIQLGQVGYIRRCLILQHTHFPYVHHRPLLHSLFFASYDILCALAVTPSHGGRIFRETFSISFTSIVTDSPIQTVWYIYIYIYILFLVTQGNVLLATDFYYRPDYLVKLHGFAAQE